MTDGNRFRKGIVAALLLMLGVVTQEVGAAASGANARHEDPVAIVARLADPDTRDRARIELLAWISELTASAPSAGGDPDPSEETARFVRVARWLRVTTALEVVSPEIGARAAAGIVHWEAAPDSSARVESALAVSSIASDIGDSEAATILALAAHLLVDDAPDEALMLRREILSNMPGSPEAPEAAVEAARSLLDMDDGDDRARVERATEAASILGAFLFETPDHPLAPEARRLLRAIPDPVDASRERASIRERRERGGVG